MTKHEKIEKSINSLYSKIKQFELTSDMISEINMKGFLYSCGRLTPLQITAFLTIVAYKYNISEQEIIESLGE